jgi:error-prone DNA polymerase
VIPNERLAQMSNGNRVSVAGLVLIRQRPGTAKGVIFMTVEDETGIANAVVWQKVFERFRPQVLGARFVRIDGPLQSASGVIHVIAERIEDLSWWLGGLTGGAPKIDPLLRTDEIRRPVGGDSRAGNTEHSNYAMLLARHMRATEANSRKVVKAMPKGRNFH